MSFAPRHRLDGLLPDDRKRKLAYRQRTVGWRLSFALIPICSALACPLPTHAAITGGDSAAVARTPDPSELKITLGRYVAHGREAPDGSDLNFRYRRDENSLWGGIYEDASFGRQARIGFDTRLQPWPSLDLALLPAVMAASRGFLGSSVAVEVGRPYYVQVGLGRTNLKPFANLNFDPNDAVTLAAGWRGDHSSYGVSMIRDDRLGTGQRHLHLTSQWDTGERERLIVDVLHKSGQGDTGHVRANGVSVTYDWAQWFGRVAYDPKQNFSARTVTRISAGMRF